MRPKTILPVLVLFFCGFLARAAYSQPVLLTKAEDRVSSEALFAVAYREALDGHVYRALQTLDESLRWDPYLVEYYLLKGYCMYLTGDFREASKNIRLYLEVRSRDPFAMGFLQQIEERMSFVGESLESGIRTSSSITPSKYLWDRLGIGIFSKGFFTLPGRPSQMGELLAFCDASRETAHLYERSEEGGWSKVFSGPVRGKVVRVLPLDRERIYLVFSDGSVAKAMLSRSGFLELSRSEGCALAVSDAALANGSLLVLADRVAGEVLFTDPRNGEVLARWSPAETVFEPVSVAVAGPLLAVGDRLGRKVYVLDMANIHEIGAFRLPGAVRSVEWMNSEKIITLAEEGDVFEISLSEGRSSLLGNTFPEAWFLFRSDNDIVVTDTRLYRSSSIYSRSDRGILVLEEPKAVEEIDGTKPFSVAAKALRPLGAKHDAEILFNGLLGGSFLEASILRLPLEPEKARGIHTLRSEKPLWEMKDLSEAADSYVANVLDLPRDHDLLERLGCFALARGITIHLLTENDLPSLAQVRLAELTGGKIILSGKNSGDLPEPERWDIHLQVDGRVLMIGDIEDGGGLFLIGRAGPMVFEDRFPLWRVFASSREKELPRGDVVSEDVTSGP